MNLGARRSAVKQILQPVQIAVNTSTFLKEYPAKECCIRANNGQNLSRVSPWQTRSPLPIGRR